MIAFCLVLQIGPKKQTLAISRLFFLYRASIVQYAMESVESTFLGRAAVGEKLGHCMWQNFVLVSGSIKSIAKGIHETFLFSGKIIFYCIVSIAICTKKVSCIFSQPLYRLAQILPLIHTLFVIRDTFGPHTYLHGPFPRPSSSWAHRISLLPPFLLGQVSWRGHGTKGNAFSGLEVLVL